MNKIITLGISLLLIFSAVHAQKIDYDNSSKWFLGFNVGGTWHTSDVKNDLNGGWGITLGKSFNYNYGKRMSFDIRARYLGGRWYGQDYSLTTFDSLSYFQQEYKPLAPYADSSSFSLVNNFQTELHSLSLELVLHANGIRERSGWDPYIFGGIGVKWFQTYGDLLNQDSIGGIYNYSSLGSDINSTSISALNDGIFDSALEGSAQDKYSVGIMPSLGVGLGYQVGKRVTLGLEHKTTFTGADVFDGYTSSVGKFKQDLYHYTSLYVQFRFRTGSRGGGSNNVNNIENYNTNQNNLTNCNTPTINFKSPESVNSITNTQVYNLTADVYNVTIRENLQLFVNGVSTTNFSFNASTGRLESTILLVEGVNNIEIKANNNCGPAASTVSLTYEPCKIPVITMVSPTVNNSAVTSAQFSFSASIQNLNGNQGVSITQNGKNVSNVSYNGNVLSSNVTLENGVNTFVITATSTCGVDTETFTVSYQPCLTPVINLVTPNSNNSTVTNPAQTLSATILNITNAQGVTLTQNGKALTGATFTAGTLRRNVTLTSGTNTFVITATNSCGTVSETITINYSNCIPPTIAWTSPSVSNSTVTNAPYSLVAQIGNVNSSQGVVLTQNGQVLSGSTFTGGTLRRNVTLVSGVNTFVITATNACGTVSETITVNYNNCIPPTISWTSPSVNNSTVTNASYSLVAQIGNVSNANGVVLSQNGQVLTGSTYTAGTLRRNVTLVSGANTFVITATNACGTVSETITINYNNCIPPVVVSVSPVHNSTVSNPNVTVTVQMQNIVSGQTIVMTQNGSPFTNFTFANGTLTATTNLALGPNVFTLTASNGCGAINESLIINYEPQIEAPNNSGPEKKITICHYPPGNNGNPQTIEIPLSAWPAHQAHGDILGPCPAQTPAPDPEPEPEQKITICHYPPGNNGNPQTIEIPLSAWPAHQAHGDILGPCPAQTPAPDPDPEPEQKITICHYPPGNNGNPQTIEIPLSAWPAHQAHGDVLGPCPAQTPAPDPEPEPEQKITICHYPPGNNGNPQTIEIPLSAWPAHQAHGDILGPCPQEPSGNGNNGQGNQGGNNSNGNSGNDQQNEGGPNNESGSEGNSNGSGLGGVGNVGGGGSGGGRSSEGEEGGSKKSTTTKPGSPAKPKPKPITPEPKQEDSKEGEGTEKEGDKKPLPQPNQTPKGKG